uniref:Uncharacterized protein n=1 Tax=Rhizophora mucronata TaxID=61149 RepID=A0A2P2R426_RHIMU
MPSGDFHSSEQRVLTSMMPI